MRIYHLFEYLLAPEKQFYEKENPIEHAIRYIQSNMAEELTLERFAAKANLSTYYFAHLFKTQTRFSPMEFVINTRLNQAKILLARTSKSVEEIACEVGYSSAGSLINIFVKKEGMSPGKYRRFYT